MIVYMDDVQVSLLDLIFWAAAIVPHLRRNLGNIGIAVNLAKTAVLHQLDHAPNEEEINLLADVGESFIAADGAVVLGCQLGRMLSLNDVLKRRYAKEETEHLARSLDHMPGK